MTRRECLQALEYKTQRMSMKYKILGGKPCPLTCIVVDEFVVYRNDPKFSDR